MAKPYLMIKIDDMEKARGYIDVFCQQLRSVDWLEMYVLGLDPVHEIYASIEKSDVCYTAMTTKSEPLALYGIRRIDDNTALIWCLGTKRLKDFWVPFSRRSRHIIRQWNWKYGTLVNQVADFNTEAKEWLKWLGAEFPTQEQRNIHGYLFWKFYIREAK